MLTDAPLLRACRGERPAHRPVWFMRQAGRSLPEFRAIREKRSFFETIHEPDLAAEITLQPVRRLGVDAAIFFSDIVTPLEAIAVGVDIQPGVGPVFEQPFRSEADLHRLRPLEPDLDLGHVIEAVRIAVEELTPMGVPLIGFAGAPFTVASYFVEGGPSRDYVRTKGLMHGEPSLWRSLCDALADLALASLRAQVGAGASAVQVFDSWAGALTRDEYRAHVLPSTARIFAGLADLGVPRIHFGVGTGELLDLFRDAGADVVGIDWRVQLDDAACRLPGAVLQGNLDPAVVAGAPTDVMLARVDDVLDRADAAGVPGHVFNLGHGVLPETDPDALARVVERVHARPPA